jgi:hypothetical protein
MLISLVSIPHARFVRGCICLSLSLIKHNLMNIYRTRGCNSSLVWLRHSWRWSVPYPPEKKTTGTRRTQSWMDTGAVLDQLIYWLISNWVRALKIPMHLGLKNRPFVPHNLIAVQGSTVPLLQFQMAPSLKLLLSSRSKKKESRYTCLSEAKSSRSQRVWFEIYSCAPHPLHKGLLINPIM